MRINSLYRRSTGADEGIADMSADRLSRFVDLSPSAKKSKRTRNHAGISQDLETTPKRVNSCVYFYKVRAEVSMTTKSSEGDDENIFRHEPIAN